MAYFSETLRKNQSNAIVTVLEKHGPLNFESIRYFVGEEHNLHMSVSDVSVVIGTLPDVCGIDPTYPVVFLLADDKRELSVPVHRDYVVAFYALKERYDFLKSVSDLRDVPESMISDLFNTAKN